LLLHRSFHPIPRVEGKALFVSIRKSIHQYFHDECLTLAASLAFYTLFALAPLLYLLTLVIALGMSSVYELEDARLRAGAFLQAEVSQLIGDRAAAIEVGSMLAHISQQTSVWWKSLLSLLGVFVGDTGLMEALQCSLNRVWKVKPNPNGKYALHFLIKRVLSLAMILGFGFLLLVSFILSSLLTVLTDFAARRLGLGGVLPSVINHVIIFLTGWVFFAAIFKFMPDAKLSAKNAMIGGLFTVILFTLGRSMLFLYFEFANLAEQLGSATGAVAIILLWVYYSSAILLFGAELTVAISRQDGEKPEPELGAVAVIEKVIANTAFRKARRNHELVD